ncbi:MAG: alpha/beta fold hydrolase [Hydrogenovibrio sp.]|uniref:alpha/beta hydrolase n=1 Tax=Hydrogenovibrio sp. TaxID=2065821 RepID=UPI002870A5EC|nr:alpha/beta fold hydrolase [Hydrogenovibrio sp.]MDR9499916.1 alpha/beta fold hydrolase [Hydrogenovibrio sp.]
MSFNFLGTALLLLVVFLLVLVMAIHIGFRAPRVPNKRTPKDFDMVYDDLTVEGRDGYCLSAWWIPAREPSKVTVIMIHGWGANKSLMLPLAEPLHQRGMQVLMVDAHNHGDSDRRGVSTMPKFAEDLNSSVAWLRTEKPHAGKKIILLGHSVGAAAALLAASKDEQVKAVISLASFAHPTWVMQRQLARLSWIPGLVWLVTRYVQWVIGHHLDDIAPLNSLKRLRCPTLLIHGDQDQVVPLTDHKQLCQAAGDDQFIQCVTLAETDHASIEKIKYHFEEIDRFIQTIKLKLPQ